MNIQNFDKAHFDFYGDFWHQGQAVKMALKKLNGGSYRYGIVLDDGTVDVCGVTMPIKIDGVFTLITNQGVFKLDAFIFKVK